MKLLKEQNNVHVTIWQTYCEGMSYNERGEPKPFKEVLFANVKSERAAENYLRRKFKDSHLTVLRIERVRGKWSAPLDDFLEIATLTTEEN